MELYLEIAKQRYQERLRDAGQERLAKGLRSSRKRSPGRTSLLRWEAKRIIGRVRKSLGRQGHADRKQKW